MSGILDGVRVFDMTLAAVGPWSSKLLGELGADVIKVESPEPEMSHQIPPRIPTNFRKFKDFGLFWSTFLRFKIAFCFQIRRFL